ncbi:hypothetical protein [Martelella alba]|uniref:Glycosyltransferase RgtA/B/C/D-like domain-containing protein n=1 Tax=Martelella alba TaxID=2590451 RepID=A0ABY2SJS5_9HYPH|nr:hypothetical protein [Martelella alba]TKI05756.1 hypothetical protein FCN80_12490 [Martelella alba]
MLTKHIFTWLEQNEHEIRGSDYNPLPVSLLFPFYLLLGAGRLSYILGLTLVYLSLVCLLLSGLMKRVYDNNRFIACFCMMAAALYVPFWRPSLRGYPDIIGLLPVLAAVLLVFNASLSHRFCAKKAIWLGILLWAPFLFRRWYAYTVVTLYITLPILAFLYDVQKTRFTTRPALSVRCRNILLTFGCSAVTTAAFAFGFQSNLIRRILHTDYSHIYSAYQASFSYSLWNTLHGIGLYVLALALLGCLTSLLSPYRKKSLLCGFAAVNLLITFVMFTRTQSPGMQHQLPFALWMLVMALIGVIDTALLLKRMGGMLASALILASVGVLINNLYRDGLALPKAWAAALPEKNYSLRLAHLDHYRELVGTISSLTRFGAKFAVFSSDDVLCDDLIDTLSAGKLRGNLIRVSQVDLRDKLRLQPFMADYLVVADPVQLHLGGLGQDVIKFPAQALLERQNIGNAYTKLPYDFVLANGVHAYIYKKARTFTGQEVRELLDKFIQVYPEWRDELQHGLAFTFLSANVSLGDKWGEFDFINPSTLLAHPGETRPTQVDFKWPADRLVVHSINNACPDADGVVVSLIGPGGLTRSAHIPVLGSHSFDMRDFGQHEVRMIVDKGHNSHCDQVTIGLE